MSLASRLMNVIASPGEVFDYIKGKPHAPVNWIVPAVLLIAVCMISVGFVVASASLDHQANEIIDKQMAKMPGGGTGPEAEMGRKIGATIVKVSPFVAPAIFAFITPFWGGLIVWLIGAKLYKGNFGYLKAVEAVGLSGIISVLGAIVTILLVLVMGNIYASPSATLFVKDFNPENPLHGSLQVANVFWIWAIAVQSIALARLSGRSFLVSAAWMFGITILCTGMCMGVGFGAQKMAPKPPSSSLMKQNTVYRV